MKIQNDDTAVNDARLTQHFSIRKKKRFDVFMCFSLHWLV